MHLYLADEALRTKVFIISAIISVLLAWGFSSGIEYFSIPIPWWVESPSIFGFFSLCIWLYNKHLWKCELLQKTDMFHIPNLNGTWKTEIISTHSKLTQNTQALTIIRQTATSISISLKSDSSVSYSTSAFLHRTDKLSKFELYYNYLNTPNADATSTMAIHQGTVLLQIAEDEKSMDGNYYTGRGRLQFGRVIFRRL